MVLRVNQEARVGRQRKALSRESLQERRERAKALNVLLVS